MMTWNFRLVKHTERKPRCVWYGVHEVFYNDAGKPWIMTEDPVPVTGESQEEALGYLKMIRRDLARLPMLDAQKTRWAKPPIDIRRRGAKTLQADIRAGRVIPWREFLERERRAARAPRPR